MPWDMERLTHLELDDMLREVHVLIQQHQQAKARSAHGA